jgi:hypothetical protein
VTKNQNRPVPVWTNKIDTHIICENTHITKTMFISKALQNISFHTFLLYITSPRYNFHKAAKNIDSCPNLYLIFFFSMIMYQSKWKNKKKIHQQKKNDV